MKAPKAGDIVYRVCESETDWPIDSVRITEVNLNGFKLKRAFRGDRLKVWDHAAVGRYCFASESQAIAEFAIEQSEFVTDAKKGIARARKAYLWARKQ